MATLGSPAVAPGGRPGMLDRPPGPSSGPTGPAPDPLAGGAPGASGGMDPASQEQGAKRAVMMMAAEIDRAIVAVSQAIQQSTPGGEGLDEIAQGRALLEQGIARFLARSQGAGAAPAPPATEAGIQFPGGGMGSGLP